MCSKSRILVTKEKANHNYENWVKSKSSAMLLKFTSTALILLHETGSIPEGRTSALPFPFRTGEANLFFFF
jgi:hypothetical protein